ncbi:MAG TPA: hypothetical protein VOA41_17520 [Candidatus Dormibacteraeota bacterium]|nr:hypothetical protein [Candidatus Dormibacteraeota bacterium]
MRTIDEVTVDYQTESLALRGSTAVPQAISSSLFYGKMDRAGQPQAPYGAGQATVVLPWYVLGRAIRAVLPGIPAQARDIVLDAVVIASSATFSALAAALTFLIFARLDISTKESLISAVIIGLATPVFAYSSWFFSEPLVAVLFLAAALCLFTGPLEKGISAKQAVLGGLALGVALWVRPTHLLAIPVFLLAMLIRSREKAVRPAMVLVCVVGLLAGAYLLRNYALFGNPLDFGYPDVAEGGKRLNSFQTPFFTGLFGFLVSPGKSVFLFAPPILLAIAGIKHLAKRDRGLAFVAAAVPLVYLFFFARYTQWEGGYCVGPRYLVPALALLCLAVGPLLETQAPWVRRSALFVFLLGFFVQAVSMATSFLEDQASGAYYDSQWNYRMGYAPLASQIRLLLHYASSSAPAPLGRGFDRWFVFLAKAGVARGTILGILLLEAVALSFLTARLLAKVGPKDHATD